MKWTELNATTKLHDPREDAFAFGKKGSSVVRVVGGCAEGNHITGCATKVLVFDVDKHSWKEEPIGLTNVNEFKSLGAGRCYNAKQDKVYDFGGTRTLGSNGPSKSNVLGVMSRNSIGGGWSWTKLAQTGAVPPVLQNPTLTCYGSFLILWGGFNSKGWYNQLYYADTTGNLAFQWFTPLFSGTTPSPRSGHSATLLGDKIYMFGGTDSVRMYQDLQVCVVRVLCENSWVLYAFSLVSSWLSVRPGFCCLGHREPDTLCSLSTGSHHPQGPEGFAMGVEAGTGHQPCGTASGARFPLFAHQRQSLVHHGRCRWIARKLLWRRAHLQPQLPSLGSPSCLHQDGSCVFAGQEGGVVCSRQSRNHTGDVWWLRRFYVQGYLPTSRSRYSSRLPR